MKKIIFSCTLLFLSFMYYVPYAFAHVLVTNGAIGAVFHIEPEDNPVAGEKAGLFFELKDTQSKLTAKNCICTVSIYKEGQNVYTESVSAKNSELTNIGIFYSFPSTGKYTIVLSGKPVDQKGFQPFSLTYLLTISKESQTYHREKYYFQAHLTHLIAAVGIFVFVMVSYVLQEIQKRRIKKL